MRSTLTTADARSLQHGDLLERIEQILAPYDPPQVETQGEKLARINRTIDEMPEIHRWFVQLWSWLDHWTDSMMQMFGQRDVRYKELRQRRDLLDRAASTAKLRYEAASRLVTIMEGFDPTGMPRQRRAA